MPRMTVTLCAVALIAVVGARGVSAQTVGSISVVKNAGNSPDSFQDGTVTSFQRTSTAGTIAGSVGFTGFRARYASVVGVDVGLTGGDTSHTLTSDYTVSFTVTAPQSYAIDVTTSANGAFTLVDDNSDPADADMSAVAGTFTGGAIFSGSLSLTDPGSLSGNGGGNAGFVRTSAATIVGVSLGVSQAHTFRFTWGSTCHSAGTFFGGGDECAVRFGLPITYASQTAGDYPGAGSRVQANDGHFVGISVRSLCGNGLVNFGEVCDEGFLNGTGGSCCNTDCTFRAAGQTCRPAAGVCDLADLCTGSSSICPTDAKLANGTVCRAAAGTCDVAETCNGTADTCPANAFLSSGTICRASAGVCDLIETCTGLSASCPADAKSTAVCRPAAGVCDNAESCNGVSNTCPADGFKAAGTACPDDGQACTADVCDGTSAACTHPAGNAGAECRAVAGACDVADHCDGSSTTCPADSVAGAFVQCRAAAGECDLAENCNGVGINCPADGKKSAGTGCTSDGNACSLDQCDGAGNACTHPAGNPGAVCRAAAGDCDDAETCTGSSTACPADALKGNTVQCRAAGGECDLAENCTGSSASCPADAKESSGTACTSDGNPCTLDQCDGSNVLCQHPAGNAGAVCRASGGECDLTETCDGASTSCPADGKVSAGTPCTADSNVCTDDQCDGAGNACTHPNNTAPCDDALYCTVGDTCGGGTCSGAARDCNAVGDQCHDGVCDEGLDMCVGPNKPDGTSCNDANTCTAPDTCTAGTCGGPQDFNACLDDFQCYKVKNTTGQPKFVPILSRSLSDSFETGLFDLKKRKHLCAPADRDGGGVVDSGTHLTTYIIKPSLGEPLHLKRLNITVTNPVGTLHLDTIKAELLLVPSAKALSPGPMPASPAAASHGVDHFKCYKVKVTKNTAAFPRGLQALVSDQFTSPAVRYDLKKPKHLCQPVDNGEGIKNAARKMLCYVVKPALGQPLHLKRIGLYVNNLLHSPAGVRLDTIKEDELCVPSEIVP